MHRLILAALLLPALAFAQTNFPVRVGDSCGAGMAGTYPNCTLDYTPVAFSTSDATPNVSGGALAYKTADTTEITDFDDGTDHTNIPDGRFFKILFLHAAVLDCSASALICNHGLDWSAEVGDVAYVHFSAALDKWLVSVSSPEVAPETPSDDVNCVGCVTFDEIAEGQLPSFQTPQTITAGTDQIDCGEYGPTVVVLSADASYTLSSNPQIVAGGQNHICTLIWNDATDILTMPDGNGLNNYGDRTKILAAQGQSVTYWYNGTLWQEVAPILPGCTWVFPGGVPTMDCGYAEIPVSPGAIVEDASALCVTPQIMTQNSHRVLATTCADGGSFDLAIPDLPAFTAVQVLTKIVDGGAGSRFAIDYSAQCRASGADLDTTFGTAIQGDIDLTSSSANDHRHTLTADITPNGTCSANSTLHIKGTIDSANHDATDSKVIGFVVRYR